MLQDEYLHRTLVGRRAPGQATRQRRPRRRARAEGRPLLRRRLPDRRSHLRDDARQVRRHRRGARLDPGPHHAVPEADRAGRRAGPRRLAGRGGRGPRTLHPAQPVATLDDGMHRHRVLQARDRRDQGPCCRPRRRARAAHPGARHPDHGAPQRVPQLVRPDPDRRHRAQGPARPRRATATTSRGSRSTSAGVWVWRPASAASCALTR